MIKKTLVLLFCFSGIVFGKSKAHENCDLFFGLTYKSPYYIGTKNEVVIDIIRNSSSYEKFRQSLQGLDLKDQRLSLGIVVNHLARFGNDDSSRDFFFPCLKLFDGKYSLDINFVNNSGESALFLAVKNRNTLIFNYLSSKDAEVNVQSSDDGSTPIHWAAFSSDLQVLNELIGRDADTLAKDKQGRFALHYNALNAESIGSASSVAVALLKNDKHIIRGNFTMLRDSEGITFVQIVQIKMDEFIAALKGNLVPEETEQGYEKAEQFHYALNPEKELLEKMKAKYENQKLDYLAAYMIAILEYFGGDPASFAEMAGGFIAKLNAAH